MSWVENQRFNRPKTKNYITEGKIIFRKLISGGRGGDYSGLESKHWLGSSIKYVRDIGRSVVEVTLTVNAVPN